MVTNEYDNSFIDYEKEIINAGFRIIINYQETLLHLYCCKVNLGLQLNSKDMSFKS